VAEDSVAGLNKVWVGREVKSRQLAINLYYTQNPLPGWVNECNRLLTTGGREEHAAARQSPLGENEKGAHNVPLSLQDAQERQPFPQVDVLTQCRGQDHILNGVVLCNFSLTAALWQFLALLVSCPPDLGQEVLGAVAVEHQLASRWYL
jgi:hypothetical protein